MSLTSDAKCLIYEQMIIQGISKAELSRMTGLHLKEIDRIIDLRHNTRFDTLESVIEHLGHKFTLNVRRCMPRK
jgi:antitoxin HicB